MQKVEYGNTKEGPIGRLQGRIRQIWETMTNKGEGDKYLT